MIYPRRRFVPQFEAPDNVGCIFDRPSMTLPAERLLLFSLVCSLAPDNILEIGTAHGGTAAVLVQALDYLGSGELYCVDPRPTIKPAIAERIKHRAHLITGKSPDSLPETVKFDFVFVDGDHSKEAVSTDILSVIPLLNSPAYLVCHDAHQPDVRAGVSAALRKLPHLLYDCGMISRVASADSENDDLAWGGLWLLLYKRGD